MTVIAAGLTSFYSWRLIFKTFFGEPHDQEHYEAAHESPLWMLIPIGILAAGSILAGFPFKELFAGHGVEEFFRESLKMNPHIIEDMENIPESIKLLPTVDDGARRLWCPTCSISAGPICRSNSPASTRCSTSSCSTNGISTSCTI